MKLFWLDVAELYIELQASNFPFASGFLSVPPFFPPSFLPAFLGGLLHAHARPALPPSVIILFDYYHHYYQLSLAHTTSLQVSGHNQELLEGKAVISDNACMTCTPDPRLTPAFGHRDRLEGEVGIIRLVTIYGMTCIPRSDPQPQSIGNDRRGRRPSLSILIIMTGALK